MSYLLEAARTPTTRVWARNSPFESKDVLKGRGYAWSVSWRTWYKDFRDEPTSAVVVAEAEWLRSAIGVSPRLSRLEAKDRYSVRAER